MVFRAIIVTTQKRNSKINGSKFYTLLKFFKMIYPSIEGEFSSSQLLLKKQVQFAEYQSQRLKEIQDQEHTHQKST